MRAGLGFPSKNSRNRAPRPSPTRGALRGARESPVQLTAGLNRTKETPTSPPAPCYAIIPARSFHALRVGNVGGERTSQQRSWAARERGRLLREDAFVKVKRGEVELVSEREVFKFFRIDEYVIGQSR